MSVFLHLRAGVVGTKVYIFDECFPTIPVSLLQGTLVLVQKRVYNDQQDPVRYFPVGTVNCFWNEAAWTSHEHSFLEVCSMPQASLTEYFLKHYKGGGVFEHEAYEHKVLDPQKLRHQGAAVVS